MATINELIATAKSEQQIRQLFNSGNNLRPSGKTRREWSRSARLRRQELAVPVITRATRKLLRLLGRGSRELTRVQAQIEPKPQ
jgi:hypothetical protein